MSHFIDRPDIYNQPIRLTGDEQSDPNKIMTRYFEDYSLSEIRDHLWSMVEQCLTSNGEQFSDPEDRANLLAFYIRIEELMEAAYILMGKENKK
jgi:hypothetical protein